MFPEIIYQLKILVPDGFVKEKIGARNQ